MEKLSTVQNLKEHVERSEKHFPRPEQVENTGGGGMLLHDHVLADGSRLEEVVRQVLPVALCHSLRLNLRLAEVLRLLPDCRRSPARSCLNQSAIEGIPAQATKAQAGLEEDAD